MCWTMSCSGLYAECVIHVLDVWSRSMCWILQVDSLCSYFRQSTEVLVYMVDPFVGSMRVIHVLDVCGVDPCDPPGRLLVVLRWTVYRSTHL